MGIKKEKICQVFHTEALSEFNDEAKAGRGGAGDQSYSSDTGMLREVNKT